MSDFHEAQTVELDNLIRRLEAHDRCLQNFVSQWIQLQSQTLCEVPDAGGNPSVLTDDNEDSLIVSCSQRRFSQERMHAAFPDQNSDREGPSRFSLRSSIESVRSVHGKPRKTLIGYLTSGNSRKSLASSQEGTISEFLEKAINERNLTDEEKQKARIRTARIMSRNTDNPMPQSMLEVFVGSWFFQFFSAVVILFNMVFIIVQTEYESTTLSSHVSFKIINMVLNAWYTLEVVLKLWSYRSRYLTGPDKHWNIMDTCLVIMYIFDLLFADKITVENLKMAKGFRVLRLARVVRIVRIFRYMRFATEFRKMILSMLNCLPTLFWSMVVLAFVTWSFGVLFTQLVTQAWIEAESSRSDSIIALRDMFQHIPFGMYFLFQSITGGLDWGVEVCERLLDVDAVGAVMFIIYIFFTFFGVLNIVTSAFVDSAWRATQTHKELLIDDSLREKTLYANHIKTVFHCLDVDDSGTISIDELEQIFENGDLKDFFAALEVTTSDARLLFRLLDYDESGLIHPDEFVEGCYRLKGEARSFDVNRLILESSRHLKKTEKFMKSMQHDLLAVKLALEARSPRGTKITKKGSGSKEPIDQPRNSRGLATLSYSKGRQVRFEPMVSQTSTNLIKPVLSASMTSSDFTPSQAHFEPGVSQATGNYIQQVTPADHELERVLDPMPVPKPLPVIHVGEVNLMCKTGNQLATHMGADPSSLRFHIDIGSCNAARPPPQQTLWNHGPI